MADAFRSWSIPGGFTPVFLFLILANFGTAIAPWMLFLILLLNDKEVMVDLVNRRWQNISTVVIMGLLVVLNGIYGLIVIFSKLNVNTLFLTTSFSRV